MKKLIYFLLLLVCLASCKDEESAFQPSIGSEAFTFKPIAGGAIMHYQLPNDADIMGLNIRYKDFQGKEILRAGSALGDSLELAGFNKAQDNVAAEVRLVKRNGDESEPIAVSFNTLSSAPYAFFDHVKVLSGWNGFSVLTDNATNAKGMAHIFYLGKDPMTNEPDTVLVGTFNITEGKDTLSFALQQKSDVNTIIIRTEDYRGYMVREESYPNIASYNTSKLDPSQFSFYCAKDIENEEEKIGSQYLFDGDTKGISYFDDSKESYYKMFLAGPEAMGEPMYIDMHKNRLTAQIRLYAMVNIARALGISGAYQRIFRGMYLADKLPCKVDVYAAKDDNGSASDWDNKKWEKVASYNQDPDVDPTRRWCARCFGDNVSSGTYWGFSKRSEVEKADSIFMPLSLLCDGQGDGYRYLKIVVNDVYNLSEDETGWGFGKQVYNTAKYFGLQEMEIYTKKED